jgi:hypothetical protein
METTRRLGIVAVVLLWALARGAAAGTEHPDASAIMAQVKAALEPARPSVRAFTMTVSAHHGDSARWTAGQVRKKVGGANHILIVMLAPMDVQGIAWLVREGRDGAPDTRWMYLPTTRRVRKLTGPNAYEAFLGSDFTHADMGFENVSALFTFVASGPHLGVDAYKIQTNPKDPWYYQRIITWVATDTKLPLERNFYDSANALWKVERFEQRTEIDGTLLPLQITMEDQQTGDRSEILVTSVRFDVDVPDSVFDPTRLRDAASAPIWRDLGRKDSAASTAP